MIINVKKICYVNGSKEYYLVMDYRSRTRPGGVRLFCPDKDHTWRNHKHYADAIDLGEGLPCKWRKSGNQPQLLKQSNYKLKI